MLTQTNDFGGYAPSMHGHTHGGSSLHRNMNGYEQYPQHSDERPRLYNLDTPSHQMPPPMSHGYAPQGVTPQHQHHHTPNEFEHEPLMMDNLHNHSHAHQYYAPPMGGPMLHVSTDYHHHTPHSHSMSEQNHHSGSKRSREDLNLKEKKRMFKLNDRINQLKTVLDEAGVQSKKNKQAILDNTAHYISMLRNNLLIAKQKAERAEAEAMEFRAQLNEKNRGNNMFTNSSQDAIYKRCFQQSTTSLLIISKNLDIVMYNTSFLQRTGLVSGEIASFDSIRSNICLDNTQLENMIKNVQEYGSSITTNVDAQGAEGQVSYSLTVSLIKDDTDRALDNIEFSFIPLDVVSSENSRSNVKQNNVDKDPEL